jgi:hypothetical protein
MTIIVESTVATNDYSWLKKAIAGWLSRSNLTARIPDFITLAEGRINRKLRVREMESLATGTLSGQTLAPPADMLEIQRLAVYPGQREVELEYTAPKNMAKFGTETGQPIYFTTLNQSLYLAPIPDAEYDYKLFYFQKIPPLSDENTSNWLLESAPDVYLYAALLEAEPYVKNDKRVPLWAAAYQAAIADLQDQNDRQQIPQSSMVIRSDMCL